MPLPHLSFPDVSSPLHMLPGRDWSAFFVAAALLGWVIFGAGYLPRWGKIVLLLVQLSIHHANPLIIHEPQQIANFLLIVAIVWPDTPSPKDGRQLRLVMTAALASYYLLAGLKKLPDPAWWNGEAIHQLLQWPPLAKEGAITDFLVQSPGLARVGTWASLLFELSFAPLAFSRFKKWLIPAGAAFHLMIYLTLEVGTFSLVMAPWYCFLLDEGESLLRGWTKERHQNQRACAG